MFANRLQKRFRHLKKWAHRAGIGAFRLYDRNIPEVPIVLDYYGNPLQPREAALCGALYKRPYEKDADDEEQWLSVMKDSASAALGIEPACIFLKQRQKQKGNSQYEKIAEVRYEKIVGEGDLSFKVNLSDYLDTGLFPDRRLLRAVIRDESAGKRVLNLFSYTGSFSVYAAAGGAISTDSVDLSNTYLSWARENFSLNGFSAVLPSASRAEECRTQREKKCFTMELRTAREGKGAHRLIRSDVSGFIDNAIAAKKLWDVIIIDPPAFSNSKKMNDYFDLNRDLTMLLLKCLTLLSADGKIFLSVNLRRCVINAAELEKQLTAHAENVRITDLSGKIIDEDFKGKRIPKAFLIQNQ